MKTLFSTLLIVMLMFSVFSCASKQKEQLTNQEEEQIKKEIIATDDSIMARFDKFDVDGALKFYLPDFAVYGDEKGSLEQYRTYCKNTYDTLASYKWTSYNIDFLCITKEKVIISQDAKNEWVTKNGKTGSFYPCHYTFGFAKTSISRKLFYHHFTGRLN
jgi:hypothetical protein